MACQIAEIQRVGYSDITTAHALIHMLKFIAPSYLALYLSLIVSIDGFAQSDVSSSTPSGPHEVSSAICSTCHKEIYAEWESSMHAQSSALSDPIHEAFYRNVMGDPLQEGLTNKAGKYPICLNCHAPNAALVKKTKLDAAASFDEGVSCIFCHTISEYKGTRKEDGKLRLGVLAYENSTVALQSPSGLNFTTSPVTEPLSPGEGGFHPFPMVAGDQAMIKSDAICLGCHDRRNNSNGVPLCITGEEIIASNTEVSCQSCHMPTENGHVSHRMQGGHDVNTIRRGVRMSLNIDHEASGVVARLSLKNRLPHNFPTGAPFRNVVIRISAYDDQGQKIWENALEDSYKVESESVLVYRLGDGAGIASGPPQAQETLSDTRLLPHEERVIEYKIPVEGVEVVRAELSYNLLWPHLVEKLDNKLTDDLKTPKRIASAEARF